MSSMEEEMKKANKKKMMKQAKQQQKLAEMEQDFLKSKTLGIYNYIIDIDRNSLLTYGFVLITIVFLISMIDIKFNFILAVVIGIGVIYFLNEKRRATESGEMSQIELKLTRIFPPPDYFYMDSGIVELTYDIQEFKKYNEKAYENMIKHIDNVLHLRLDIERGVKHCEATVDIAKDERDDALNSLHSIIYKTPSNREFESKLTKALESLQYILQLHIDFMIQNCNNRYKKSGPNINNKMLYQDDPKPIDNRKCKDQNYYVYY
tara:strand:- start:174 stop:962 length:789 start_codon:yes stop_codon:yes gene_type:complete